MGVLRASEATSMVVLRASEATSKVLLGPSEATSMVVLRRSEATSTVLLGRSGWTRTRPTWRPATHRHANSIGSHTLPTGPEIMGDAGVVTETFICLFRLARDFYIISVEQLSDHDRC